MSGLLQNNDFIRNNTFWVNAGKLHNSSHRRNTGFSCETGGKFSSSTLEILLQEFSEILEDWEPAREVLKILIA